MKRSTYFWLIAALFVPFSPCPASELPPPYDSVEVIPPDYHGWFANRSQLAEIFENEEIHTVIEVGTWLGKSAMWMARRLPEGGKLYAVDHWLGSEEHQLDNCDHEKYAPHRAIGYLYQQFLSNVIHRGLTDKIVPVRMDSLEAAATLEVEPDLIYIDAAHDYHSVKKDLEAWYAFVGEKTVFCGDDWSWDGVRQAVTEFAAERDLRLTSNRHFWRIFPN